MRNAPVWVSVVATVASLLTAGVAAAPVGSLASPASTGGVEPLQTSSLTVEIFDFFNVPFQEYWDWRGAFYGDVPVGATCFSFGGIPSFSAAGYPPSPNPLGTGACDVPPSGYSGETWEQYPYMDWYPWYLDRTNTIVYAPYRMQMVGTDQPGSTLAQPVILPVFNSSQSAGTTLRVVWDLRYITSPEVAAIDIECNAVIAGLYDGFVLESTTVVTMDVQESRRIFGVAGDPATFWASTGAMTDKIDPRCGVRRSLEFQWQNFMAAQGGRSTLASGTGPYDLASSFEWYYQAFATNFESATVDPVTGLWTIVIKHWSWGTEALLGRWFYWGSTPYYDLGADGIYGTGDDVNNAETYPHRKSGWWPWEFVWFEDVHFDTTIGATSQDFTFGTVVEYHFLATANPGPDGILHTNTIASTDDVARWVWQPVLADYIYGGTIEALIQHTISELDPYTGLDRIPATADDLMYLHNQPGSVYFGQNYMYEYTPAEWDLGPNDRVIIRAPTAADRKLVKFIDPYSPLTSNPVDLIFLDAQMGFSGSKPPLPSGSSATDSDGDGILDTVTLVGPIDWGAPDFRRVSYPVLEFEPAAPPIQVSVSGQWSQLFPTQRMDLTVQATVSGMPLPGGAVGLGASSGLVLGATAGMTDPNGIFKTTVTATQLGAQTVTATVNKDPFAAGTDTFAVEVASAKSMTIGLTSDTTEMMSYETATIQVRLTDTATTGGVSAAQLTIVSPAGGNISAAAEIAGGTYGFRWDSQLVTVQTFAQLTVRAKVGGYTDVTSRITILVDPNKSFSGAQLFLIATPEKSVLTSGETITVTVFVFTIEGYVVRGSNVVARMLVQIGTLGPVVDRLNGVYTFTYTAPVVTGPTSVTIRIDAAKLTYGYGSGTARLTIQIVP